MGMFDFLSKSTPETTQTPDFAPPPHDTTSTPSVDITPRKRSDHYIRRSEHSDGLSKAMFVHQAKPIQQRLRSHFKKLKELISG